MNSYNTKKDFTVTKFQGLPTVNKITSCFCCYHLTNALWSHDFHEKKLKDPRIHLEKLNQMGKVKFRSYMNSRVTEK